ncbi:hypothetical protein MNBD_NITROSPINAE04-2754 [hydrothermal vent metagenome]|uniref:Uncharacterized protein n=1 Tax=hydrothermal vent metagenome TaxID=652676 RepID=A0A3B1CHZ9_9ZZZZ
MNVELIEGKIVGIPYAKTKTLGDTSAPKKWTDAVIKQTENLPKIEKSCSMKITFFLPSDKYPSDYPYGPDLDNLLKRFLDALNKTILREAPGKDSCIVKLEAEKKMEKEKEKCGAEFELIPLAND